VEPGHGAIPQRASAESRDDRSDASTFALASAATEYAALRDERNEIGADGGSTPEIDTPHRLRPTSTSTRSSTV